MAKEGVPKKVLLDGTQMALSTFLAGTMGFLKERNIPIMEWVSYMGVRFTGQSKFEKGE